VTIVDSVIQNLTLESEASNFISTFHLDKDGEIIKARDSFSKQHAILDEWF